MRTFIMIALLTITIATVGAQPAHGIPSDFELPLTDAAREAPSVFAEQAASELGSIQAEIELWLMELSRLLNQIFFEADNFDVYLYKLWQWREEDR